MSIVGKYVHLTGLGEVTINQGRSTWGVYKKEHVRPAEQWDVGVAIIGGAKAETDTHVLVVVAGSLKTPFPIDLLKMFT